MIQKLIMYIWVSCKYSYQCIFLSADVSDKRLTRFRLLKFISLRAKMYYRQHVFVTVFVTELDLRPLDPANIV